MEESFTNCDLFSPIYSLAMASLSLRVAVLEGKATKTIQFDPNIQVFDACRIVREKIPESKLEDPKEYGLFLVNEDPKKGGVWLENNKSLGYYLLKTGVSKLVDEFLSITGRVMSGDPETLQIFFFVFNFPTDTYRTELSERELSATQEASLKARCSQSM